LLELSGYRVLEASNGEEALKIARQCVGSIDLLLTDVIMPGINGWELSKRLVDEMPQLKVVFMSGYTGQAVGENPSSGKRINFLQKPYSRESLTQKVREAFETFESL
jgi:CheY-like chemotaxis protein